MKRHNWELLKFVQNLLDIHNGIIRYDDIDRCIRWMDAVLPPPDVEF